MKKNMSNTTAIMIVAIGLFVIVSTFAIIVRIYEIGGTKKAPLFTGELDEKIDFLSSNNLREYISKVGIEHGATTYLRNFSCVIGPHFRVEKMEFSIDSLMSMENIRLFRYSREEGKTLIDNLPQNLAVIKVQDGKSENAEGEAEKIDGLTIEQFGDALRFYLPTKGREGPKSLTTLELRKFENKEALFKFMEETGAQIYIRRGGQYQPHSGEDYPLNYLYESSQEETGAGVLYELEYY